MGTKAASIGELNEESLWRSNWSDAGINLFSYLNIFNKF